MLHLLASAPAPIGWPAWLTAAVLVAAIGALVAGAAADLALMVAAVVLLAAGVLTPAQAVAGFANEGMLTVAALFVVAAGLQRTGAIGWATQRILRADVSERGALLWLCIPVASLSAFLNNTPIVAVMIPTVIAWAKRARIPASKLLIPLSFAAILGGTVTIIGTSTNLVVQGLILQAQGTPGIPQGMRPIGFFELAWVGLPLAIMGIAYIAILGPELLPARQPPLSVDAKAAREYTARLRVERGGLFDGRTVEQAGLRQLPGLFLVEIDRGGDAIPAPGPTQILRGDDILVFAGVVESVMELRAMRGLVPDLGDAQERPVVGRNLVEAVVSDTFPGLGQTIRALGFRRRYDAAVIAVARNGARIHGKLGDVSLHAGDTLLLDADEAFVERQRNNRDFYLVGQLDGSLAPRHDRAWLAITILAAMVGYATWSGNMLLASFVAAALMMATRCLRTSDARGSLDLSTLLVIAASLGISRAIETTGLGGAVGGGILHAAGGHPVATLAAVYGATMLFTAFASNAAAAAIMFPIAVGAAAAAGHDPMPYVLAILFAASADFATPIGYQTNLMVYGPGGYRFSDYLRIGLPLNLLAWGTTVTMLTLLYGVGASHAPVSGALP